MLYRRDFLGLLESGTPAEKKELAGA